MKGIRNHTSGNRITALRKSQALKPWLSATLLIAALAFTGCNLPGGTAQVSDIEAAEAIAATLVEASGGDMSLVNPDVDQGANPSIDSRSLTVTRVREYEYSSITSSYTKTWYNGDWVTEVTPPAEFDRFEKTGSVVVSIDRPNLAGEQEGSMDLRVLYEINGDSQEIYTLNGNTSRSGDMTRTSEDGSRTITRTINIDKTYTDVTMLRTDVADGNAHVYPLSGTLLIEGSIFREATGLFGNRTEERILDAEITYDGTSTLRIRFRDSDTTVEVDAATGDAL